MLDTRLYTPVNDIKKGDKYWYDQMETVGAESSPATSIEVLAGKVVKFLLTYRGSDPFDPSYGGIALHHRAISELYLPKLRIEMLDDIDRCVNYITKGEKQLEEGDRETERIFTITLLDIVYHPKTTPTQIDVYIQITSTTGKKEVVAITNRTDQ